jgi:hypothetical protein
VVWGGRRTGDGRGVWAERRAAAPPPAGVVEEAAWARVGGGGGDGEEPAVASSVEVDPAAARLWAADLVAEAPPELGGMGRRRGQERRG